MNKNTTAVTGAGVVLCALFITIALGFATFRMISTSFNSAQLEAEAAKAAERAREELEEKQRLQKQFDDTIRETRGPVPVVIIPEKELYTATLLAPISLEQSKPEPTVKPFADFPDYYKNRVWWEIAMASDASKDLGNTGDKFTLTFDMALPIAKKYGISVLDLFNFFREGAEELWRQDRDLDR